jgi:hypothetical protein
VLRIQIRDLRTRNKHLGSNFPGPIFGLKILKNLLQFSVADQDPSSAMEKSKSKIRDRKIQIRDPDPQQCCITFFQFLGYPIAKNFFIRKNFNRLAEICLKLGGKSTKFLLLTLAFYSTVTFASFSIDYLFYTEALLWHAQAQGPRPAILQH